MKGCVWFGLVWFGLVCFSNSFFYPYLQGVPHHIGLLVALNYDFRDHSENLRKMNHLKKLYKATVKIIPAENTRFFEYYVRSFGMGRRGAEREIDKTLTWPQRRPHSLS